VRRWRGRLMGSLRNSLLLAISNAFAKPLGEKMQCFDGRSALPALCLRKTVLLGPYNPVPGRLSHRAHKSSYFLIGAFSLASKGSVHKRIVAV
jgi:hypothetical protein